MRSKKKTFAVFMSVLLVLSLAGCGAGGSATADGEDIVTLHFLHKWPQPEYVFYFDELVASFEDAHPNIKIEVEAYEDESIKDKLRILMGASDAPDIFFSWSGEFAQKFIRNNAVLDLTPYLEEDAAWKDSIMEAGLEPFSDGQGHYYGIPLRINGKFFVYNKDIFDQVGVTAPTTYDEFLSVCEQIKQAGITPLAFGNIEPWAGCHYITTFNQKLVKDETRRSNYYYKTGDFTDPGYVKALHLLKDLNDKEYFNYGSNAIEHNMCYETFGLGQQAMFYVELEEFKDVDKNVENWGFFPMPAIPDGAGNQNFITGAPDGFMVSQNTEHPEEAVTFLKYMTSMEQATKLVNDLGWPSPVKGAVEQAGGVLPQTLDGMKFLSEAEGMALWLDTDINIRISDVWLPGIQEVMNGTKTPEQLMQEVDAMAKKVAAEEE